MGVKVWILQVACWSFVACGMGELSVDLSPLKFNKDRMLRDCAVRRIGSTDGYDVPGVSLQQLPHSFLDGVFAMSQGQPKQIILSFIKDRADRKPPQDGAVVVIRIDRRISLQSGVPQLKLISCSPAADNLHEYRYRFASKWGWGNRAGTTSHSYRSPVLYLHTDLPASDASYPFSCHVEYDGYQSKPCHLKLRVIPAIRARQPRRFHTGVVSYTLNMSEDRVADYVSFIKDCGFNAESVIYRVGTVPLKLLKAMKEAGITRFLEANETVDAISMGTQPIPRDHRLCLSDGQPFFWYGTYRTCPYAVYSKGRFYRENLIPYYRRLLVTDDLADHIMPNWEPFKLGRDYCFCPNCKREFARYAGLELADVMGLTGDQIRKRHPRLWARFSSYSHGLLVRAVQGALDEVCAGTGKSSLFLPEVNVSNVLPGTEQVEGMFSHYSAKNYVHDLKGICPWGPYDYYHANAKYTCLPGYNLNQIKTAEFLHRAYPGCRMYMLVHGYQCVYWVTTPEGMSFETFGNFLAGLSGSFVYYIDGYDARYYAALSVVNDMIADSEDFLAGATPVTQARVEAVSPVPPRAYRKTSSCEGIQYFNRNTPILYSRAFSQADDLAVFAGNSWSGCDVYGTLKVKNLKPGPYLVILPDRGTCLKRDAKALADVGVTVRVPPLTWLRMTIRPASESVKGLRQYDEKKVIGNMRRDWKKLLDCSDRDGKVIKGQEKLPAVELYGAWR